MVWPLACFALGIAADRFAELSPGAWLTPELLVLLAALALTRRGAARAATACVLAALVCAGGARHALSWTLRGADDVALVVSSDEAAVQLRGVIASTIEIIPVQYSPATPAWLMLDRSVCLLRCEALVSGGRTTAVSGLVRMSVSGHLLHARMGDRVDVFGVLQAPAGPRFPGDYDFRAWLRGKGIDRVLQVEHPAGVVWREDAAGLLDRFGRSRQLMRESCEQLLGQCLSERTRGVGTSLLLGTRTGLHDELRDAFVRSGTMHILAISGLHVSVLAGCVLVLCRVINASARGSAGAIVVVLAFYTALTDLRPPVLRAAVFGGLVAAGMLHRSARPGVNLLAATAGVLLLLNPSDLFDLGGQLSFLAVAAIFWSAGMIRALRRRTRIDAHRDGRDPPAPGLARKLAWFLVEGYLVTAAIWLFTLPLTIAWFHLVSPVGFLINVILAPFSLPLLAAGFLTMGVGLLVPEAAWLPGLAYELCLQVLVMIVEASARAPWGCVYVDGPGTPWLIGFYGLLALALALGARHAAGWCWRGLALWTTAGLAAAAVPRTTPGLTCTFIHVGHGGAALLQLPGGRTLLFDAGAFGSGDLAARAIDAALRELGAPRLDAVVISHADADHYNAVPELLERRPVGAVYLPQRFLDFHQPGVVELCDAATRRGVSLTVLQQGDRLQDDEVRLEVLHPQADFRPDLDNAHSLVLEARYAGRTLLFTGDLEQTGLGELLQHAPPRRIDVLQSPHHGARSANTADLARWATPLIVVAQTREDRARSRLQAVYVDAAHVFTTAGAGSIRISVDPEGEVSLDTSPRMDEQRSPPQVAP